MSTTYGKPGADMLHEVTEAYEGALISQKSGVSSPASNVTGTVYPTAHSNATSQSGQVYETVYNALGIILNMLPSGVYPPGAASAEWHVNDEKGNKVIIQKIP